MNAILPLAGDAALPGTAPAASTVALAAADPIYARVKDVVPPAEWALLKPVVDDILRLKAERGAVILAHNYMTPDIFHTVADFRGDSLALAREAARTDAKVIVQAGVHFMAETSKILSPDKTVLIPDLRAGCSLAESITGADVRLLRQRYPGLPVVTYVNTSAEVKAESDITCTSANAAAIVEAIAAQWGVDRVLFLPDEYLAQNVQKQTRIRLIAWKGHCEVHERFTAEDIRRYRAQNPGVVVLAHPECPVAVCEEADFTGSTGAMIDWVKRERPARVVMVTECSMSDNVAAEVPDVAFVRPCNLCPHMKRITLDGIRQALLTMTHEVTVDPLVAARARRALEAMLAVKPAVAKAA